MKMKAKFAFTDEYSGRSINLVCATYIDENGTLYCDWDSLSKYQRKRLESFFGGMAAYYAKPIFIAWYGNEYTFDVWFDDDYNTNCKGFNESLEYCRHYIRTYNGSDESYFADYKGGWVSIRCNETEEQVYIERVLY